MSVEDWSLFGDGSDVGDYAVDTSFVDSSLFPDSFVGTDILLGNETTHPEFGTASTFSLDSFVDFD